MGLWWRWQDLNLRPWDYDAPASAQNQSEVYFIKHLLSNILNILKNFGAYFPNLEH